MVYALVRVCCGRGNAQGGRVRYQPGKRVDVTAQRSPVQRCAAAAIQIIQWHTRNVTHGFQQAKPALSRCYVHCEAHLNLGAGCCAAGDAAQWQPPLQIFGLGQALEAIDVVTGSWVDCSAQHRPCADAVSLGHHCYRVEHCFERFAARQLNRQPVGAVANVQAGSTVPQQKTCQGVVPGSRSHVQSGISLESLLR